MNFAVNILWIAIGLALIGAARSFALTRNRGTATAIGAIGLIALGVGLIL